VTAIVLVHGGFCGGWIWRPVADRLRAAGHDVFAATLTGLGDRVHLADPAIDLDVHAQDVLNLLRFEDLRDVVLVGHSYGGLILELVGDRAPERIARRIYVDALVLEHGESITGDDRGVPQAVALHRANAAANNGFLPVPGSTAAGAAADPVAARLTPHPFACFEQALVLEGRSDGIAGDYIACLDRPASDDPIARFTAASFALSRARAEARGWEVVDDPASHFGILAEGAERLADFILARAEEQSLGWGEPPHDRHLRRRLAQIGAALRRELLE
jgi:pimeloyl-ACP methyl ester carboxylesterase